MPTTKHTPYGFEQTSTYQDNRLDGGRNKSMVYAKSLHLQSDCVVKGEGLTLFFVYAFHYDITTGFLVNCSYTNFFLFQICV
jgi:hypothetical protein